MPIKSDGNGNFIVNKQWGISLALMIIIIGAIVSSISYAKGLESKIDTNKEREYLHYTEIKEDMNEIKGDIKSIKQGINLYFQERLEEDKGG